MNETGVGKSPAYAHCRDTLQLKYPKNQVMLKNPELDIY
jgi:hypothetical protein